MLKEGHTSENAMINYMPAQLLQQGIAVFIPARYPIHGIVDNYWIDQLSEKGIYCTDDSSVPGVGADKNAGKVSPRKLQVTTVTKESRMATSFQSKEAGVSLKDRASILPFALVSGI